MSIQLKVYVFFSVELDDCSVLVMVVMHLASAAWVTALPLAFTSLMVPAKAANASLSEFNLGMSFFTKSIALGMASDKTVLISRASSTLFVAISMSSTNGLVWPSLK